MGCCSSSSRLIQSQVSPLPKGVTEGDREGEGQGNQHQGSPPPNTIGASPSAKESPVGVSGASPSRRPPPSPLLVPREESRPASSPSRKQSLDSGGSRRSLGSSSPCLTSTPPLQNLVLPATPVRLQRHSSHGGWNSRSTTPSASARPSPSAGAGSPRSRGNAGKPTATDFRFGRVLGEGAYARVLYASRKDNPSREFAVKIMEKRFIKKEGKVKFVMMERKVMSASNHPNIVKLSYTFQDKLNLYMVMELCRGGELLKTIRHFVDQNTAVGCPNIGCPVDLTRYYGRQLVSALDYMHSTLHIAHRDLKPENILINEKGRIKVADFGTAKDMTIEDDGQNAFVGTAEYVSPEALRDEEVGQQADFWSLGCVLYQMLVGRPLFRGASEYLTFQEILEFTAETPLLLPDHVPPEALDLIRSLLHPDPALRLGCGPPGSSTSVEVLKSHAFFDGVDVDQPPYIPPMSKPEEDHLTDVDGHDWELAGEMAIFRSSTPIQIEPLPLSI